MPIPRSIKGQGNPSAYLQLSQNRRHTISEVSREQILSSNWPRISPDEVTQLEADLRSDQDAFEHKSDDAPYHVFSQRRKLFIVYLISFAGFFSPFSSNIYFPALADISKELHVSASLVALTITSYMVVQGLAPSFWGPLSDGLGRRQILIATLLVYLVANIALGVSNNYPMLLIFRGVQSAGSAATISIGAGVIGDIASPAERGSLIGTFGGIRMFGQSVGPVIGGLLTEGFGFHSIFWTLAILGGLSLLTLAMYLPETLRSIAGDGTIPLAGLHKPWIYNLRPQPYLDQGPEEHSPEDSGAKKSISLASVLTPFRYLAELDMLVSLTFGAVIYTIWSMVTSTTTPLFKQTYQLNNLQLGLAFLPNGAGCILGSYMTGLMLNVNFRTTADEYARTIGLESAAQLNLKDIRRHPDFPIEHARQRNIAYLVLPFVVFVAGYGFSLELDIDLPLVLQFLIAYTATAVFSVNSALVVDLVPGQSAGATALNNLLRCSLGAVGVGVAPPLLDALGPSWAFVALAAVALACCPLLVIQARRGPRWRRRRAGRGLDR